LTAIRPDPNWTPATIQNAINTAEHLGRPWPITMRQLISLAELDDNTHPDQILPRLLRTVKR
ncbi:hypothetical protein HII36_54070, partial [Nonomuraea sp. NN258]|uniref:hypothetical protein n=1 Tax=Nonomuraea antri TaxID=2730852 RepID=UPI001568C344